MKSDVGKFAIVPLWLLERVQDGTAIRLFAVMAAKYVDRDTDVAFPSRAALATDLGVSRDTVDRAVKVLVEAGALTVTPRVLDNGDRTSNLYAFSFVRPGSRICAATPSRSHEATPSRIDPTVIQNHPDPESIEPEAASAADAFTRCIRAYDGLMGTLAGTPPIQQAISDWLETAPLVAPGPAALFEEACSEAALNDGKSLKYVLAILKRWQKEGKADRRVKSGNGHGAVEPEMIVGGIAVKTMEQELAEQRRSRNGA